MKRIIFSLSALLLTVAPAIAEQNIEETAKINFTDHVLPIFREHCLACHNANDADGGLTIDSYGAVMAGGGGGQIVSAGDAASSRLYQVISHAAEPNMPPEQDQLPKAKLEIIAQWINDGLLENSGSKAKKKRDHRSRLPPPTPAESRRKLSCPRVSGGYRS